MSKRMLLPVMVSFLILFINTQAFSQNRGKTAANQNFLDRSTKQRVLKVGIFLSKPSVMHDKTDEFVGFEIDLAARLAEDIGARAQYFQVEAKDIIPNLLSKQYDIIICGLKVNEERSQKVDFTNPYNYTGMSIIGLKEYKVWFRKLSDFNNPNVNIVALKNTNAGEAVKKFLPKAKLRLFSNESMAIQALLNKKAHAMVASSTIANFAVIKYSKKLFIPLTDTLTKEPIAIAIRKNDPKALTYLNKWIQTIEEEGWLQERKHFWFKTTQWESLVK